MRRIVAAMAGVMVALALCEAALRVVWRNPYRSEKPDRIVTLRLQHARMDQVFDRSAIDRERPIVRFRTDGRSYILPSRRHDDPQATVLFLGGSTTACDALPEEMRFPALVGERLGEKGMRVDVLNAARAGNTSHDSLNVLLNHGISDHPDVVVMMHAANDAGLLQSRKDYSNRMGRTMVLGDVLRWAGQVGSSDIYLFGLVRRWSSTPPLAQTRRKRDVGGWDSLARYADEYRSRLRAFIALSRAFGIEPVLMTQPLASFHTGFTPAWLNLEAQDHFNGFIRAIGAEENATVIDLVRFLEREVPRWQDPMKVFYDGMHVTDEGSRLYAEHIADRLAADVLPRVRSTAAAEHPPAGRTPAAPAGS